MQQSIVSTHRGPIALPVELVQAQLLCFEKTAVIDLGRTARAALSGILSFISLRNLNQKIWPKRETLRVQARLNSESSLYRGLAELTAKGYISRERQLHHSRNGRFHVSRIGLTEKAIGLLNLNPKKIIHTPPSGKMRDGHMNDLVNNPPSNEETPGARNLLKQEVLHKTALDPNTRLPKPLVKLTGLGLTPKCICWLMRLAKQHQKRLESVMNHAWPYLLPLTDKGGQIIKAYLRKLITKKQFRLNQDHTQIEAAIDSAWWQSTDGIELKAKEMGLTAYPGESYPTFAARILKAIQQLPQQRGNT